MDKDKSLIIPEHAFQEYSVAHRDAFALPVTATILGEDPGILRAVGRYLRTAARSHPVARNGHWHAQVNKVRIGAYSFMVTLEEGHKDHPDARYLPREYWHDNSDSLALWYWHISMVQFHEDSGAQLPMPLDQAVKLAEEILSQETWAEWFRYGVNAGEPLVIHGFIPYQEEREDGI